MQEEKHTFQLFRALICNRYHFKVSLFEKFKTLPQKEGHDDSE